MSLETLPLLLAAGVALIGLLVLLDAWLPDGSMASAERRRSPRIERHRGGEACVGLGIMLLGAAIAGRDGWSYSTVAVLAGAFFLVIGALLNLAFLREAFSFRGPARRRSPEDAASPPPDKPVTRTRIR